MKVLMEHGSIQIAYTEKRDLSFIVDAERKQENAKYIGHWTFEQHADALNNKDILHLLIKSSQGENIGYAIIRGRTNQNGSIELMRIVITKKEAGYGKTALSLIVKWCFEVEKAHRLWLDVRENNVRAQHVYQSQGFFREGVLRECIKVGDEYQSLIVMSILCQEYHVK